MLKSYLLTSWRNLLRNRLFSIINITGLAIGITSVFLIYLYNVVENSYETSIRDVDRIYRVPLSGYAKGQAPTRSGADNHPAVGPAMKAAFPEIEEYARMSSSEIWFPSVVVTGVSEGKPFEFNENKVYYADPSLIDLFQLSMVEGNAATSLADPYSIVLTESIAKKYFGDESPLQKTVTLNREDYKITGVVSDLPLNTHLNFQILLSYPQRDFSIDSWSWPQFYTYVKIAEGTDLQLLQSKFKGLIEAHVKNESPDWKMAIDLQPVTDIHLNSHLGREMKNNGDARQLYFIGLLGVLILVIAWINYINLSTAKAIERAKEVGLRKIVGAGRFQLVTQFLLDSLFVNVGAVLIALVLITASVPSFETLTGVPLMSMVSQSHIITTVGFWTMPLIVFMVGVLAVGCYPALVLSSFEPAIVLKGKFAKSGSGVFLRKLLVGFQYVLSIILIGGTIVISNQIDFMQSQDLGYNPELLIVKGPTNVDSTFAGNLNKFRYEMGQIPGVIKMGKSTNVPGGTMQYANSIRRQGSEDIVTAYNMSVDGDFFATYEIPLLAGRSLTDDDWFSFPDHPPISTLILRSDLTFQPERNKVMINERLSEMLGFKTPEEAIGQKVRFNIWGQFTGEILGVVKNYHQRSLRDGYEPILYYRPDWDQWQNISIKVETKDVGATIQKIGKSYANAFPANPFEYSFLNEDFNRQYKGEHQFRQVISVLTGLAMVIACLGLIGLGLYSVGQRIKEIGIRKVLGAPVSSILILFCGDSAKIVGWSTVIALPLLLWGTQNWLSNFAFHIDPGWRMFIFPPLILLCVSIITIVTISLRAATINPVKTLKSE